jgi:hypothetical protein
VTVAALFIGADVGGRCLVCIMEKEHSGAGDEFGEFGVESTFPGEIDATLGGSGCHCGVVTFGVRGGEGGAGGGGFGMRVG